MTSFDINDVTMTYTIYVVHCRIIIQTRCIVNVNINTDVTYNDVTYTYTSFSFNTYENLTPDVYVSS